MMEELDKAIEVLRMEYEIALKMDWIRHPVAYALYQTWRHFDKEEK